MFHPQSSTSLSLPGSLTLPQPHRHPTAFALNPNLNRFSSSDYQATRYMASFSSHDSYSFSSCDYAPANLPSCNITPKPGLSNLSNLPAFSVNGPHDQTCLPSCCYDTQYNCGNVSNLSTLTELSPSYTQRSDQADSFSYKSEVSNGTQLLSYSTNFLNYPSNSTYDTVYPECNRSILPSCALIFHVPDPMSSNLNGTPSQQDPPSTSTIPNSDDPQPKRRPRKTKKSIEVLERAFAFGNTYPDRICCDHLAEELGLTSKQVWKWFVDRRRKERKLLEGNAGRTLPRNSQLSFWLSHFSHLISESTKEPSFRVSMNDV